MYCGIPVARAAEYRGRAQRGFDPRSLNALGTANILRRLTLEQQRNLLDLFTRSAGEMLDDAFESDLVKALYGFDAISAITPALMPPARPM